MQENYIVGIYARLSRDDERAGESVSIENQKEMLSRYVREQSWTLYDYYCDDGVSGTTFDRPGLNRLVQDATDHKINLVLCKDLSRLGRDYIEAGKYTDFVFPSLGCRFIALNDGVDTLRKNNEMLVILKNVMNDLYARDTSSKIKAVKLSTFKSGKYVGCYAPLGYRKSEADKHVLEIDPVTAPVVRHIFDLRLQGYGFRKIALQLAASRETESSVDAWLDMMQDYAQLEELDRPTLVRLVQKIEISERYTVDDHEERDIHIYYNFVGYIEA